MSSLIDSVSPIVVTFNEEFFVRDVISPLAEIFSNVTVVDIGSRDRTIDKLRKLKVNLVSRSVLGGGISYTNLKNELVRNSGTEWVLWVDGDEVFFREDLREIPTIIHSDKYDAYRVSWIHLVQEDGKLYQLEPFISDIRLFRRELFKYERSWPREMLMRSSNKSRVEPVTEVSLRCWHLRFVIRSSKREPVSRRKKREYLYSSKFKHFDRIEIPDWPWKS